jgi:hypothetical protein
VEVGTDIIIPFMVIGWLLGWENCRGKETGVPLG